MPFKICTVDEYGVKNDYARTNSATEVFDALTELGVENSEAINVFFWAETSCDGEAYVSDDFTVVSL